MSDRFQSHAAGLESPGAFLAAVTPDDEADLATASRALCVAQSGEVRATTVGGTTETVYIAAGVAFPIRVARVWATGTTAAGIVSIW
ncbi:spike base protein, RCAP_Rcc01079 family [Rhodovulum marinum]|uniref:Uncharacterized protein n=1 Tax=Rhodovulum marinum TaxID=320662 RepID=A0A4R2QAS5_9RHOB|nr:hypothetical protein [Rhodovulum marinum]TCP43925.1 hypothetical protein EV662_1018 [Rhodovulum marinum]